MKAVVSKLEVFDFSVLEAHYVSPIIKITVAHTYTLVFCTIILNLGQNSDPKFLHAQINHSDFKFN